MLTNHRFPRHLGLPDAARGAHAPARRGAVPRPGVPPPRRGGRTDPGVRRPPPQETGRGRERTPGKSCTEWGNERYITWKWEKLPCSLCLPEQPHIRVKFQSPTL